MMRGLLQTKDERGVYYQLRLTTDYLKGYGFGKNDCLTADHGYEDDYAGHEESVHILCPIEVL